ncbi:MAG: hypothetical protein J7J99_09060 [Thermoprotei archaeon]|nr:hypothetical protein [Thermoprotei archaeon]
MKNCFFLTFSTVTILILLSMFNQVLAQGGESIIKWRLEEDVIGKIKNGKAIGITINPTVGMDGVGSYINEEEWPSKGSEPIVYWHVFIDKVVPFLLYPPNEKNSILVNNVKILLPEVKAKEVWFLYTATSWVREGGELGAYVVELSVEYDDGGNQAYKIPFVDWCGYLVNYEDYVNNIRYYHHPAIIVKSRIGKEGDTHKIQNLRTEIWACGLVTNESKVLKSIVIPYIAPPRRLWVFALTIVLPDGSYMLLKADGTIMIIKEKPVFNEWLKLIDKAEQVIFLIPYSHWDIDWLEPWSRYRESF